MAHCLIALGSNLGDRAQQLRQALAGLASLPATRLMARSRWLETPPIGGPAGQGPFLNGAALVSTSLAPAALLAELRRIESASGRVRADRWAARSLDVDLLLYEDAVIQTAELEVPHPRMAFRRFVLEPAAEIVPWMIHPENWWSIAGLLQHLNRGAEMIAVAAADEEMADQLIEHIATELNLQIASAGPPPSERPSIARWSSVLGGPTERPKLLLAVGASAGVDTRQLRRMLQLPLSGPVVWVAPSAADGFHEALAAVQSVWPRLAT